jgi:hypothetical protein
MIEFIKFGFGEVDMDEFGLSWFEEIGRFFDRIMANC